MSGQGLLDQIESPDDLRKLTPEQVVTVTEELRTEIIQRVSRTGGHLASSLGAVELLTAMLPCSLYTRGMTNTRRFGIPFVSSDGVPARSDSSPFADHTSTTRGSALSRFDVRGRNC